MGKMGNVKWTWKENSCNGGYPNGKEKTKLNAGFLIFHSKWDLVGYNGGSHGLENAVKRWGRLIGPICFSVYFDASP